MKTLFLGLSLLLMTLANGQQTLNDVKVPAKFSTGESDLALNGAGIRTKYFFKLYVGALYLESKTSNMSQVLNDNSPIAVNLHITSSLIDEEKMYKAIKAGFKKSAKNPSASLKAKIDNFLTKIVKNKVKDGDLFSVYYLKNSSTVKVSVNGKEIDSIEGEDFRKAIFGIWLGNDPVDEDLLEGMKG